MSSSSLAFLLPLYSFSAYNGNKMLVFGGGFNGTELGTLYILDVPTMTWTRGPSSQPRKGMACAAADNNFVVWGGTCTKTKKYLRTHCLFFFMSHHMLTRFVPSFIFSHSLLVHNFRNIVEQLGCIRTSTTNTNRIQHQDWTMDNTVYGQSLVRSRT